MALRSSELFSHHREVSQTRLGVNLYPGSLSIQEVLRQDGLLRQPTTLSIKDIPAHVDTIVTSDAFYEALEKHQIRNHSSITRIDAIPHFQAGKEGIISFFSVYTENKEPVHLISHISRIPIHLSEKTPHRLEQEFTQLSFLADQFQTRLQPPFSHKYRCIKPLSYSEDIHINKQVYPIMMTPFIEQGELRIDGTHTILHRGEVTSDFFDHEPMYRYAVSYTEDMKTFNKSQTPELVRRDREIYRKQLIAFNACIYHLTRGRMIQDLRYNAGDVLVTLAKKDSMFTLSALHNGFSEPINRQEWYERMEHHIEHYATLPLTDSKKSYSCYVYPTRSSRNTMMNILKYTKQQMI